MYSGMKAAPTSAAGARTARVIDLRSDTVTRPSEEMLKAMAQAEVGDDVYGEDPTVAALEARAAETLGKEAAVFVPTGTQSNLVAMLAHCQRGDEYIVGDCYHIYRDEGGGPSVLGGVSACPLPTNDRGELSVEAVAAAIKVDDPHYAMTRLICLENTVHGHIQNPITTHRIGELARSHGLAIHLDGARLMNASVASGQPARELAQVADTVSVCLSKGLGAPAGSVLCGSTGLIHRARRARKLLGGAMRQSGFLAACGLYALEHNVDRLADDHRRARLLADNLAAFERLTVDLAATETNMVFVTPLPEHHGPLRAHLSRDAILTGAQSPTIRLVTHLDISDDDIEQVLGSFRRFYRS
jgi:threonine aldolase